MPQNSWRRTYTRSVAPCAPPPCPASALPLLRPPYSASALPPAPPPPCPRLRPASALPLRSRATMRRPARYCDAVDLNCGCPQSWAMQGGYGAKLLKSPDLIRDMVRQARARTGDLPVSIKIRIDLDLQYVSRLNLDCVFFCCIFRRMQRPPSHIRSYTHVPTPTHIAFPTPTTPTHIRSYTHTLEQENGPAGADCRARGRGLDRRARTDGAAALQHAAQSGGHQAGPCAHGPRAVRRTAAGWSEACGHSLGATSVCR